MSVLNLNYGDIETILNGLHIAADECLTAAHNADMNNQPVIGEQFRASAASYRTLAVRLEMQS